MLTARGEHVRPAVDSGPSCLLLTELARAGWRPADIADAAGVSIRRVMTVPRRWLISARLADRIAAAHAELTGCPPCRDYIDPVAVRRIMAGEPPAEYTLAERRRAVAALRASGMPFRQIAARLGINRGSVDFDLRMSAKTRTL